MPKFILLLLCFSFVPSHAQEGSSLAGQVIDSSTQLPIPFAHIRLGESIAVSNQHGNFILRIKESDWSNHITLSCIGYKSATYPAVLIRRSGRAVLTPEITELSGVVISELSPQAIFRKAEKNGQKNYRTSKYKADYTIDQWVFYEDSDSLVAVSTESGTLINKGLEATDRFPEFNALSREVSSRFLAFDTSPTPMTFLTKKGNTVSPGSLLSHNPVRIGLLKEFHIVPVIFSEGFYQNTEQQTHSIVSLDSTDYYLITVYPKTGGEVDTGFSDEIKEKKIKEFKELAEKLGRTLSDNMLDSLFSSIKKGTVGSGFVIGIFLVNTQNYGISHALIKQNIFDSSGKIYAKIHVAASYIEMDNSYYLQSLDVLMKRTAPPSDREGMLYYLLSLNLSNFQTKKLSRLGKGKVQTKITNLISPELQAQFGLDNIRQFIQPIKDCTDCELNKLRYFNRTF